MVFVDATAFHSLFEFVEVILGISGTNSQRKVELKVGWKKDFVHKFTPVLTFSGWTGVNLLKKSDYLLWFNGCTVFVENIATPCAMSSTCARCFPRSAH